MSVTPLHWMARREKRKPSKTERRDLQGQSALRTVASPSPGHLACRCDLHADRHLVLDAQDDAGEDDDADETGSPPPPLDLVFVAGRVFDQVGLVQV